MNKKSILSLIVFLVSYGAFSQTLFTYGDQSVDVKEFVKAYTKNNAAPVTNKEASVREYLDLYIRSRLKVKEAYARRYDTLPQVRMEVRNLRNQITDTYMADPQMVKKMADEAFARSQKDIRVSHIFISFSGVSNIMDTVRANKILDTVLQKLKKGTDFNLVAQQHSSDPLVSTNKGNVGYITVFTLPYEFENAIYSTSAGKYSLPVRSKSGYHIFKNVGERKALGKIKAQQILLPIPPGSDAKAANRVKLTADSVYKKLIAGADFSKMASALSSDYISAANGGTMPDITIGQFDPVFENALTSLTKDGAISKPFLTSHGWHIVKRIKVTPVISDPENKDYFQELQTKITNDGRWKNSRDFIYQRVRSVAGFKRSSITDATLWNFADSLFEKKPMNAGKAINMSMPVFTIGDSTYRVASWMQFATAYRFREDGTGVKPHETVFNEYLHASMINYYKDHLEDFNVEFWDQMTEFKDGNLFFEIMQQEVWNKSQTDTASLRALYETNKAQYVWKQSADAIVFFCSDEATAKAVQDHLAKNNFDWKKAVEVHSEKVVADSSRFEWEQLPNLNNNLPREGMLTAPLINPNDNTASFAYILKVYTRPTPRNYDEAKGLVINDYQELIEKQWTDSLKKKYPVKVNESVLKTLF